MNRKNNLFTLLLLFGGTLLMGIATTRASTAKELDQLFKDSHFEGAVLIAKHGIPILHKGYGTAVREWNIPISKTTKFSIASLSKTFTETLIMMLVEEKKLSLDDPLGKYLPMFSTKLGTQITVKQLLRHRSGIPRLFKIPGWTDGKSIAPLNQEEFLSLISAMPLEFPVNSRRQYSSANYYLLGAIIESVTGQSFSTVLHEKILHSLKLKHTDVYQTGQLVSHLARNYKRVAEAYSFCPAVVGKYCAGDNVNLALFTASGSMHSTVKDLTVWSQALDDNRLLTKQSRDFLFNADTGATWSVQTIVFPDKTTRTLMVADGELEGSSALLMKIPDEKITIAILNNTGMNYQKKIQLGLEVVEILVN